MTIANTSSRTTPSEGNGSNTSFPFTFKVFSSTDVVVVHTASTGVETVLVETTNYTISVNADQDASPGGTVTYPASGTPLPAGEFITVYRSRDYAQTLDLVSGGAFNAENIEDALDSIVMQLQQILEAQGRTIKLQVSDVSGASVELPAPVASRPIGWNADGDALANLTTFDAVAVSAYMETVLDDIDSAAARTTLGLVIGTDVQADVVTTRGDLVVGDDTGAAKRLARGTEGQLVTVDANGDIVWVTPPYMPSQGVLAPHQNLVITNTTSTTIDVDADLLVLTDGTNFYKVAVNTTVNTATSGAINGTDTGSLAAGMWHIWVVSDGVTTGAIISTSATWSGVAAAIKTSYPRYGYAGAIYATSGSNLRDIYQTDNVVAAASTTPLSGGNSTSYAAVDLSAVVPATAKKVNGTITVSENNDATVEMRIASTSSGLGEQFIYSIRSLTGATTPAATAIGAPFSIPLAGSAGLWYKVNAATESGNMHVTGWEY